MLKITEKDKKLFVNAYLHGKTSLKQSAKFIGVRQKDFEKWLRETISKERKNKNTIKLYLERFIHGRSH